MYGLPGLKKNFQGMMTKSVGACVKDKKKTEYQGKKYFNLVVEMMGLTLKIPMESEAMLDAMPAKGSDVELLGYCEGAIVDGRQTLAFVLQDVKDLSQQAKSA